MDAERWREIREAFDAAVQLEGPARTAFLDDLRARDPDAFDQLQALLTADSDPNPLLEAGALGIAEALSGAFADAASPAAETADVAAELRERIEHDLSDRFELLGELGQGGMAVVFSGLDRKHDRRVAIKVMRPEVAGLVSRRRFGVEIRLAAQLNHPHVVPLYDSGVAGGLPYYVTAEVPGDSLAERIATEGALLPADTIEIARGVASALEYAHRRKIVHRDIKPSNILLHDHLALLTDFGIGKALSVSEDSDLTAPGIPMGTPRYMAPEQLAGATVDERADLYAFGLVAYEMLCGEPAAPGGTPVEIIARRTSGPVTPPSSIRRTLPRAVDRVFAKILDPDPDRRFGSAMQFVEALEAALSGVAPEEKPQEVPSVAVIPFRSRAPGEDDDYLSEGISEQLIHRLSGVAGLRVTARASSFAFKDTSERPADVAGTLDVRYLVTGSVQQAGDRIRITVELADTESGGVTWSESYDRELTDVFALQDEIAEAIADVLSEHLIGPTHPQRAAAGPVPDLRAYQYYLKARHEIFTFTAEGLARAVDYLKQGLKILGDNVPLLSALGYAYWQRVNAGLDPDPANLDLALECAERIRQVSPGAQHAHRLEGLVAIHQGRPVDAIEHLSATLAADPNDVDSAFWLTLLLGFRGQPHRVEPFVRMMQETDPLNPLHQMLPGFLALMRGQTAAAPAAFRQALDMEPANPVLRLGCGQAEAMAGETDAALETLRPLEEAAPGSLFAGLARLLRRGLGDDVEGLTEEDEAAAAMDLQWCWTAAQGYAMSGDLDAANEWLEKAVAIGFINYPLAALYDPLLRSLRRTEAFERLMKDVEEKWAASLPEPA